MPMDLFVNYLKKTKTASSDSAPLKVAMGNTSGDMDSIVGCMLMAYYLHLQTGDVWTPVVNCAKADLPLSVEIFTHVVKDCQLAMDDMLFWDEFTALDR